MRIFWTRNNVVAGKRDEFQRIEENQKNPQGDYMVPHIYDT